MRDLLLRGGEVLTRDGRLERADVLVRDGVIAAVGDCSRTDAPVVDASATIVAPGLVNAHHHSNENLNPGLYEGLPLDLWFVHSHQVTRAEAMSADAIYTRTLLGAIQQLRAGTTAVVDFVFEAPEITLETLEPIVRAYRDVGMRATILLGVADLHFLASVDLDPADRAAAAAEFTPPSVARIMEIAHAAIERWHEPGGLIGIGLGPSAPQRCSEELLRATAALARDRGLVWQTHVQETRTQAVTARRRHGRSFVAELDRLGVLGAAATLVHTVWLDEADRQLMGRRGVSAVHCPCSNLRLGDGIADVPALRRAGVEVALGTDGRGCDETLDLLGITRLAALLHKVHGRPPEEWLTARDAFAMATTAGSRCAGHGDALGRVEPGARADLILLRRDALAFTPLHDALRQLVFGATSRDIRSVIVDGRVVVRDDEVPGVDVAGVQRSAERLAAEERALAVGDVPGLERVVRRMFDQMEASPHHVNAYVGG